MDKGSGPGSVLTRRRFVALLGLSAATGLLAACGGSAPSPPPASISASSAAAPSSASSAASSAAATAATSSAAPKVAVKKQLAIGLGGDLATLDPHFGPQTTETNILGNIYDSLISRYPDRKIYPRLATEWKSINDTTWQFKLRKDVKFHDGSPLTPKDVKFSFERIVDPNEKTLIATTFTTIDHVDIVDDSTVNFVTKKPDPLIPQRLATYGALVIPMDYFKKVGADEFKRKPMGSGPLKLKEWVRDDHLLFERFDGYWGDNVPFETVLVKPLPEPATRLAAFVKGEVDIIARVTPDHIGEIEKSGKGRVELVPFMGIYQLGVNYKVPPLDNKLVKQALSLAIDRQALLNSFYAGKGTIPSGPIPPGGFAYDPSWPPLAFDLKKAKEVLAQSGYKNEPLIIESATNVANEKNIVEAIVGMWKDLGVNAKQEIIEMSVRGAHYREKTFKGFWMTDTLDLLLDPDGMMWRGLSPGGLFDFGWRNPEFDKLGDEARFTLDQNLREKNYKRMRELALEFEPWIQLYIPEELWGVANGIEWKGNGNTFIELRGSNLKIK